MHTELLLHSTRSTLTLSDLLARLWLPLGFGCYCVAVAAFGAHGATSAWQVQHFDSARLVGARLVAVGIRLLLRGNRSIWCTWIYFCVAGEAPTWMSGLVAKQLGWLSQLLSVDIIVIFDGLLSRLWHT